MQLKKKTSFKIELSKIENFHLANQVFLPLSCHIRDFVCAVSNFQSGASVVHSSLSEDFKDFFLE